MLLLQDPRKTARATTNKPKTNMAKKEKTAGAAIPAPETPKKEYLLFNAPAALASVKAKRENRRNLPRMIKPGNVPVGGCVSGEIIAIVNSPVSTVKGLLLHLKHETGDEFLFPCTGVIRQALAPGREKDDGALKGILEKEIGKNFYAVRQESTHNDKYKKDQFMFDVYTT